MDIMHESLGFVCSLARVNGLGGSVFDVVGLAYYTHRPFYTFSSLISIPNTLMLSFSLRFQYLIIINISHMAAAQCPADFFQSGSGCFGIVDQPGLNMTWDECRSYCQAYSSAEWTVDLASFDDCYDLETFCQTWRDVGKWF